MLKTDIKLAKRNRNKQNKSLTMCCNLFFTIQWIYYAPCYISK